MSRARLSRLSGRSLIALAITALLAVLSGYLGPPPPDEGVAAHVFQLAIAVQVPMDVDVFP
jgi:hypothetical protein